MSGGRWKNLATKVLRKLVSCAKCPIYGKRELLVSRRTRAFRLIFCSSRLYNIIGSEPGIFLQKNSRSSPKLSPHNSLVGCSPKRASEIEPCNLIISPSACFVGLGWFMWLSASPRVRFCSFWDPPSVFSRLFPMLPTHSSPSSDRSNEY